MIYLLYIGLVLGVCMVVMPIIQADLAEGDLKAKLSATLGGKKPRREDRLTIHLKLVLSASIGRGSDRSVLLLMLISGTLFGLGLVLTFTILPITIGLIASFALLFLPYCVLRTKLQTFRVAASREGDLLISELLNNYKICYYNMQEAIGKTAVELEEAPHSKKLLFNLARGLNTAGEKEEIEKLLQVFSYGLGTSWGKILATNILFATTSGIKVTDSLKDLSESMVKARKVLEYAKRENNEAAVMLKYLAPVCFVLTVLGAIKYFGFTLKKYLSYQFLTETGITWVMIILGMYILGIMVNVFCSKKKMEL